MDQAITIVSGLPRSGTSMMMNMLQAGGIDVMTDHERRPDVDNPKGYFELERVKKIAEDATWLNEAQGRAFKMVARLLRHLPDTYPYQVIFMKRAMQQMLRSQAKMLERLGKPAGPADDGKMADLFAKELAAIEQWLSARPNMRVIYVDYGEVVAHPSETALRIKDFLNADLDLDVAAMAGVVDEALHRNR